MKREDRVDKKYEAMIASLRSNRTPIIEDCNGCKRIDGNLCNAALSPQMKWHLGHCNLATHKLLIVDETEEKKRAGQQKSKKKSKR